jgi:predicted N-formylglutamate amidohydrolase
MEEAFYPVELIEGDWSKGLLLICDHARNTIPAQYGTLGVREKELVRHIAYDIGARDVTLGLAHRLGVPAVLSTFSRLLIDPNRGEDDPTIVMRLSDGTVIPGNHPISEAEIASRIERFHRPYHDAVDAAIRRCLRNGVTPAVLSIHSFTPSWKAFRRPWQVALLWDSDPRFTDPLINALRARGDLTVGDNEPYDGALRNDTMVRHCTRRGLAHALIEIRQDLIGHEDGANEWCDLLAPMLEEINGLAHLHAIRHFGSRTGPVEHVPDDLGSLPDGGDGDGRQDPNRA